MRFIQLIPILACLFPAGVSAQEVSIIPTPKSLETGAGYFELRPESGISVLQDQLTPAAQYLAGMLSAATGYELPITQGNRSQSIVLELGSLPDSTAGAYKLNVSIHQINILANDYNGIVNGISSLRQLFPAAIESKSTILKSAGGWILPTVLIHDSPRFQHRGLLLDVSRHFFDKEEIMRLLDRMALYKLNKFHWHLTDNEGWRIEIKAYPELTEKGAWRTLNSFDHFAEQKAITDNNPDLALPRKYFKEADGNELYGGYYTQEEIKQVVAYAAKLGIDVIPEIDMPGHFASATAVFPQIVCENSPTTSPRVMCVGKDETIALCKRIYAEVFELFPYEYAHLGADEVDKTNWSKCSHCQKRIADNKLADEKELQSWFVHEMEGFFNAHGKRLIGWEEIMEGGLSETSTVMWWLGQDSTVISATKQGNQVISAPNTWAYFCHKHNNPDMQTLYAGTVIPSTLPSEYHHLVLGGHGTIWGEYVTSEARMEYQGFPRILALSEICWTDGQDKNWPHFSNKIKDQLPRLDSMGVNYFVPYMEADIFVSSRISGWMNIPPDEWLTDTIAVPNGERMVRLRNPYANTDIRYTQDGTIPTVFSPVYTSPLSITAPSEYTFATFRPDSSRAEFRKVVFVDGKFIPALQPDLRLQSGLELIQYDVDQEGVEFIEESRKSSLFSVTNIDIPEEMNGNIVTLSCSGYFYAPKDSTYTFTLRANGIAQMWLHDDLIFDQGDRQFEWAERGKQRALARGYHPIKIVYSCEIENTWNKEAILTVGTKDDVGNSVGFPGQSFWRY